MGTSTGMGMGMGMGNIWGRLDCIDVVARDE